MFIYLLLLLGGGGAAVYLLLYDKWLYLKVLRGNGQTSADYVVRMLTTDTIDLYIFAYISW